MLASRQVVNAMQARLLHVTDADDRVYTNRSWPVADFPALRVVSGDEDLDVDSEDITWPRERQHGLQVLVVGIVRDVEYLDDAMDALAEQVLIALEGSVAASLLEPLQGVRLKATRITRQVATENEAAVGTVIVAFEATYGTASNNPSVFLF